MSDALGCVGSKWALWVNSSLGLLLVKVVTELVPNLFIPFVKENLVVVECRIFFLFFS